MARNNFAVAATMAALLFSVLALFQLVATGFGLPSVEFSRYQGLQQDGQVPFQEKWEPRDTGNQYLLGVGKADITG